MEETARSGQNAVLIMGATASGKSALAMEIAEKFNGEIISADSMQLYRGLDIGTAKASKEEQSRIRHHLLDILDIHEKSDIYRFCTLAEAALKDIRNRGKLPIIAGGSGLYIHALLYGLDPLPAKQELRDELDRKYDNDRGFPTLLEIMRESCPLDYERWNKHRRKLIRAYEVFLLSGSQISELQHKKKDENVRSDIRSFYLHWERSVLLQRIESRTETMLQNGWIEETEALLAQGLLQTPTAWQALGYALIAEYLNGKCSRADLKEKIVIATRQFARRQDTWFRNRHPESFHISLPREEE